MNAKLTICLIAAAFSSSACAAGTSTRAKFTVVPRVVCSAEISSAAAGVVLDAAAGTAYKEVVSVNPLQCKVKTGTYVTFYPTSKVDKAVVIFLKDEPGNSCASPVPGGSPVKDGTTIFVFPNYNGFVQPVTIKIADTAQREFRYCVELGLDPMPNPAIIIKE